MAETVEFRSNGNMASGYLATQLDSIRWQWRLWFVKWPVEMPSQQESQRVFA